MKLGYNKRNAIYSNLCWHLEVWAIFRDLHCEVGHGLQSSRVQAGKGGTRALAIRAFLGPKFLEAQSERVLGTCLWPCRHLSLLRESQSKERQQGLRSGTLGLVKARLLPVTMCGWVSRVLTKQKHLPHRGSWSFQKRLWAWYCLVIWFF